MPFTSCPSSFLEGEDLTNFLVYTTAAVNLQLKRTCFSFALAIPKQSERSGFRCFILPCGKLEDRYMASDHRLFGEAGRPNCRSISQTTFVPQLKSRFFCCNKRNVTENETTSALVRTPPQISICSEEAVKATKAKVALAVRSE